MADTNFAPISEDDAEVLAKLIREKAISTNGGNIGRPLPETVTIPRIKNVLSLMKKSSQIDLSFRRPLTFSMLPALKSVTCPNPTRNWWMTFLIVSFSIITTSLLQNIGNLVNSSLCNLREKSERCFLKILSHIDACDRFYERSCACDEDQTITILSGRTLGTTLAVDYV